MFGFLSPVKGVVAVTVLVFVACNLSEVAADYMLKPAVDLVQHLATSKSDEAPTDFNHWLLNPAGAGYALFVTLAWLAGARVIFGLLAWLKTYCAAWQSMHMVYYMREAVYDRLQRVGFSFYDQYSTGQLINRALNDLQQVRNFVVVGLQTTLDIVLIVIGYFGLLLYRSPMLALLAAGCLPFWFLTVRYLRGAVAANLRAPDERLRRHDPDPHGEHRRRPRRPRVCHRGSRESQIRRALSEKSCWSGFLKARACRNA